MRRALLTIAIVLTASTLAGCAANPNASAGDFEGDEREVAQVIDDLKSTRDYEEVCSRIFTDELAQSLEADGHDCVEEVEATRLDVADTGMDVENVTITGDTATAEVSQEGQTATFELERSGESWQISSLG